MRQRGQQPSRLPDAHNKYANQMVPNAAATGSRMLRRAHGTRESGSRAKAEAAKNSAVNAGFCWPGAVGSLLHAPKTPSRHCPEEHQHGRPRQCEGKSPQQVARSGWSVRVAGLRLGHAWLAFLSCALVRPVRVRLSGPDVRYAHRQERAQRGRSGKPARVPRPPRGERTRLRAASDHGADTVLGQERTAAVGPRS